MAAIRHQQQRFWRVIVKAHPPGPRDVGPALRGSAILRNLQKPRPQSGHAVQIGFHGGDITLVTFGKRRRLGLGQGRDRQKQGGGKQGAAEHGFHVDCLAAKGKAPGACLIPARC